MSRKLSITFVFAVVFALTAFSIAQDNSGNNPPPGPTGEAPEHGYGHRHFDPTQPTEMLTKQLKLTSEQQSKVLDILKSEQSQMEKLHSDSSLSQDDRGTQMMDMHKSSDTQIRALLDPDQQKKWDKMQSQRGNWQGHHHEGQDSGAAPPQQN